MSVAPVLKMTYSEYLALEAKGDTKHEYLRGEVWAMAGGTPGHALVASNLIRLLGDALRGRPCVPYGSDLRVRIDSTDRSTYPDVTVICGKLEVSTVDANGATNPTLLIEVLSEATAAADRGEKFAHYRRLASLRDYVLASPDSRRVEVFSRGGDGEWTVRFYELGQRISLPSLSIELSADAVFDNPNA